MTVKYVIIIEAIITSIVNDITVHHVAGSPMVYSNFALALISRKLRSYLPLNVFVRA